MDESGLRQKSMTDHEGVCILILDIRYTMLYRFFQYFKLSVHLTAWILP